MALDPGSRRIGVALSDELGLLARPLVVIKRTSRARDLERIRMLIDEYGPVELLVGLPLYRSGQAGPQARQSERFAETVRQETKLPVRLWDESYSTLEARERRRARSPRRGREAAIDAEAAAVFLQQYLDARR